MCRYWRFIAGIAKFRLTHFVLRIAPLLLSTCNDKNRSDTFAEIDPTHPIANCKSELIPDQSALLLTAGSADETEFRSGALVIGSEIVDELKTYLEGIGVESGQINFISSVATHQLNASVGSFVIDTSPITNVMPPIIKGAFFSLSDSCSQLNETADRMLIAKGIMKSSTGSLGGRIGNLDNSDVHSLIENMTGTAVRSLDAAGLGGAVTTEAVSSVTNGTVGALASAGIGLAEIGAAAKNAALGVVSALASTGASTADMGMLAGNVASAAMLGLLETGLSSQQISDTGAISSIVSGASSGLSAAGVPDAEIGSSIGSIAGFAIRAFEVVGFSSVEMKEKALSDVIDGAVNGVKSSGSNAATIFSATLHEVSKEAVKSLLDSGFSASEVSSATSVIIRTGISKISESGLGTAANAMDLASAIVKGAMEGTAKLEVSGKIDSTQSAQSGAAAMQSALNAVNNLKNSSVIWSSSETSILQNAISTSIAAGFRSGGASAESQASVQSSVQVAVGSNASPTPTPEPQNTVVADTTSPTISSIAITSPDGTYGVGESITLVVSLSETVFVVGAPFITLETGVVDRLATYNSGTGTSSLSFVYQVEAGDQSAALDYISASAFSLNSGTIRDAAGNNAVLTLPAPGGGSSLVAGKSIVIDTTQCDANFTGKNLLSSIASGGAASVVGITGINGAVQYGSSYTLTMPSDCSVSASWNAQGTLCDGGDSQDSMTTSYQLNWQNLATWGSNSTGVGILVIDLGAVRTFNKLRVFQTINGDGKMTHVNFYTHPHTSNSTAPLYSDSDWSASILPNGNYAHIPPGDVSVADKVSNPTAIDFDNYLTTRYLKVHAMTDNTQGGSWYIEIRSIKMFCD